MTINKYKPVLIGRQFILNTTRTRTTLSTVSRKNSTGDVVQDVEAYNIYPEGREFVGCYGFVGSFWRNPFYRLCENTFNSVTFYSESYTKRMMPDWIEGTMANTMVAYDRVFKAFLLKYPDASRGYIDLRSPILGGQSHWEEILDYSSTRDIDVENSDSFTTGDQEILCYPFIIHKFPKILSFLIKENTSLPFKGAIPIYKPNNRFGEDGTNTENFSFPNVDVSKLNILLPDTL